MNKKVIFSVIALPIAAIIAFGLVTIFIAITGTYNSNNRTIGYFIFGGAALLYLLSLIFIWKRKVEAVELQPWSYLPVFLLSGFFGPGAGYLITWQNLRRMGKQDEAKKFLMFGGVIFVLMIVGIYLIPGNSAKILGDVAAIGFPIWLYYAYQQKWQVANPNQVKFSWPIVGWAILGTLLSVIMIFILGFIIR